MGKNVFLQYGIMVQPKNLYEENALEFQVNMFINNDNK